MSASKIHNILKKKDPKTFENISQMTINGWIERPVDGSRPQWTDQALAMVEAGKHQ